MTQNKTNLANFKFQYRRTGVKIKIPFKLDTKWNSGTVKNSRSGKIVSNFGEFFPVNSKIALKL